MPSERENMRNLVEFYKKQIEKELGARTYHPKLKSKEYQIFKKENMPRHISLYEKLCNLSEKILRIKPDKKKEQDIKANIDIAHLNITPSGAISFSFLAPLLILIFGSLLFFLIFQSTFFIIFFFIMGISMIKP